MRHFHGTWMLCKCHQLVFATSRNAIFCVVGTMIVSRESMQNRMTMKTLTDIDVGMSHRFIIWRWIFGSQLIRPFVTVIASSMCAVLIWVCCFVAGTAFRIRRISMHTAVEHLFFYFILCSAIGAVAMTSTLNSYRFELINHIICRESQHTCKKKQTSES